MLRDAGVSATLDHRGLPGVVSKTIIRRVVYHQMLILRLEQLKFTFYVRLSSHSIFLSSRRDMGYDQLTDVL